jgi:hypothetical protein
MDSSVLLAKGSRTPDIRFRNGVEPKSGAETAVFFLDDEQLSIHGDMAPVEGIGNEDECAGIGLPAWHFALTQGPTKTSA